MLLLFFAEGLDCFIEAIPPFPPPWTAAGGSCVCVGPSQPARSAPWEDEACLHQRLQHRPQFRCQPLHAPPPRRNGLPPWQSQQTPFIWRMHLLVFCWWFASFGTSDRRHGTLSPPPRAQWQVLGRDKRDAGLGPGIVADWREAEAAGDATAGELAATCRAMAESARRWRPSRRPATHGGERGGGGGTVVCCCEPFQDRFGGKKHPKL